MGSIKYSLSQGLRADGGNPNHVITALIQTDARNRLVAEVALVDNSGGVATLGKSPLVATSADAVNVANAGSNLAAKAGTEAALAKVVDALSEVYAKAKALGDKVGVLSPVFAPTVSTGTIVAIGNSGAGAATGVKAAELNGTLVQVNRLQAAVAAQVNAVLRATGEPVRDARLIGADKPAAAVVVSGGVAGSPGVTKAYVDAKLAAYASNVASLAAALNGARGEFPVKLTVVS